MKRAIICVLVLLAAVTAAARAADPVRAVAVLHPTKDSHVAGTVWFIQENGKVHVVADITGLTPGPHGFHVHEFGDATSDDASAAGGHYNPHKMHHAGPTAPNRHAGDLGNLVADAEGKAHLDVADAGLSLEGADSVIGRAVIVHASADDLTSQPAGNAGRRVACGVIGVAGPVKH